MFMRKYPIDYSGFLIDHPTVEEYVKAMVDPASAEIEHLSLLGAFEFLLKDVGIDLEVHYMDRSQGSEATKYRLDSREKGDGPVGTVRLLYRPCVIHSVLIELYC
jgi:ubiquitin thioesterase protein OTUB1